MNETMKDVRFFVITFSVFLSIGGVVIWLTLPAETQEYELWGARCPWGEYYSDVEGNIFFMSSSLGEGYVLKYLVGGELKTLIVDSQAQSAHVFLLQDSSMAWVSITWSHWGSVMEVSIYVPDPKLMS